MGGGGRAGGGRSDFCLHGTHCDGRGLFYTGAWGVGVSFIALLHCCRGHWAKTLGRRGYCYSPSSTWRCAVNQCCHLVHQPPFPQPLMRGSATRGGGGEGRGQRAGTADMQTQPVCLSARGSNVPPSSALPNDTGNQRQVNGPHSSLYHLHPSIIFSS